MNASPYPRMTDPADRGPLRVMFLTTTMTIGGYETLLFNMIRRIDRQRVLPELCCLKEKGELGEALADEVPVFDRLLRHKFDVGVVRRLERLFRERRIDAVVTVGTGGDRMFWGRLGARRARVAVVVSAIHSTGVPDYIEWPNRLLARWTDAFIGAAAPHARYLIDEAGCPSDKVVVIPYGIDPERFAPRPANPALMAELGLTAENPVAGIVAVLRPEKHHELFLRAAALVRERLPEARFLIVGDGPRRPVIEQLRAELNLQDTVQMLGKRTDVPELLALMDVLLITSHMECSPVSILEAMGCGKAVIATRVGSIPESVEDGRTGFLVPPGDAEALAGRLCEVLSDRSLARQLGEQGRARILERFTLDRMTRQYEDLVIDLYRRKCRLAGFEQPSSTDACAACEPPVEVGTA